MVGSGIVSGGHAWCPPLANAADCLGGWVGRAPLRLLFHLDVSAFANISMKGSSGDEEANQLAADWITRIVLSWELMVGWLIGTGASCG